jgi:myo-inositol-1(or 4)-monophosphatase
MDLKKIKDVAIEAAVDAGKLAASRVNSIDSISRKSGYNDLVTDVDKACEDLIIGKISSVFPDHSILAEESGEDNRPGEICWVIDPIDGTINFAHGFPFFCTSIGVLFEGEVILGAVYEPVRGELFFAEKGKGAFLDNKQIQVSDNPELRDSLIATGFAYNLSGKEKNLDCFRKMLLSAQAVRRAGSAALDLCYVACGRFDGFWERGLKPWDTAAGELIVRESGGTVSTLTDLAYDIFKDEIVASNTKIHQEMKTALNS